MSRSPSAPSDEPRSRCPSSRRRTDAERRHERGRDGARRYLSAAPRRPGMPSRPRCPPRGGRGQCRRHVGARSASRGAQPGGRSSAIARSRGANPSRACPLFVLWTDDHAGCHLVRVLLAQANANDGLTHAEAVAIFCTSEGGAILPGLIETAGPSASSDEVAPPVPVVPLPPTARVVARRVCQVTFAGMPASEEARGEVHAWVERLGELTSPMMTGQVLIEAVDRDRKERHYRVRMDLTMPTGVVVVDHDHPNNRPHEDLYVAIRNAFRAARRQLEVHREGLT